MYVTLLAAWVWLIFADAVWSYWAYAWHGDRWGCQISHTWLQALRPRTASVTWLWAIFFHWNWKKGRGIETESKLRWKQDFSWCLETFGYTVLQTHSSIPWAREGKEGPKEGMSSSGPVLFLPVLCGSRAADTTPRGLIMQFKDRTNSKDLLAQNSHFYRRNYGKTWQRLKVCVLLARVGEGVESRVEWTGQLPCDSQSACGEDAICQQLAGFGHQGTEWAIVLGFGGRSWQLTQRRGSHWAELGMMSLSSRATRTLGGNEGGPKGVEGGGK